MLSVGFTTNVFPLKISGLESLKVIFIESRRLKMKSTLLPESIRLCLPDLFKHIGIGYDEFRNLYIYCVSEDAIQELRTFFNQHSELLFKGETKCSIQNFDENNHMKPFSHVIQRAFRSVLDSKGYLLCGLYQAYNKNNYVELPPDVSNVLSVFVGFKYRVIAVRVNKGLLRYGFTPSIMIDLWYRIDPKIDTYSLLCSKYQSEEELKSVLLEKWRYVIDFCPESCKGMFENGKIIGESCPLHLRCKGRLRKINDVFSNDGQEILRLINSCSKLKSWFERKADNFIVNGKGILCLLERSEKINGHWQITQDKKPLFLTSFEPKPENVDLILSLVGIKIKEPFTLLVKKLVFHITEERALNKYASQKRFYETVTIAGRLKDEVAEFEVLDGVNASLSDSPLRLMLRT